MAPKDRKSSRSKEGGETEAPLIVNLEELADMLELSLPTLRRLIKKPGFPIEKQGGLGAEYEFDAVKVSKWKIENEARVEEEKATREAELAQCKLDLFGGSTVDKSRATLSPRDQQIAIKAELDATNLARLRRELVNAAEMEAKITEAFVLLRTRLMEIGSRVAKAHELDRAVLADIDAQVESALRDAAARLEKNGEDGR